MTKAPGQDSCQLELAEEAHFTTTVLRPKQLHELRQAAFTHDGPMSWVRLYWVSCKSHVRLQLDKVLRCCTWQ